jgi:putative tryptophan/tyrosine transport system substrate-binding protein
MSRIGVVFMCLLLTVFLPAALAEAQQPTKVPRIGFLSLGPSGPSSDAFRRVLSELGYVEGQNILIEYRHAGDRADRLPDMADELVRLKVDVIVAQASQGALAAKHATSVIPVVFYGVGDPVEQGLVASLARPGGNITGLASLSPELGGKKLELLKEVAPRAMRVAVLWNPNNPSNALQLKEVRAAAHGFSVGIQSLEASKPEEFELAFDAAARERANALIVFADPFLTAHRVRLANLTAKRRLPAIYGNGEYVEAGGLMSYAPNFTDMSRRAAIYVDKILKGTKPGDLPVEQPTKFELVINLKAAKQIGLTIPQSLLFRADRVIK